MLVRCKRGGFKTHFFESTWLRSGLCGHKPRKSRQEQAVVMTFLLFNFLEEYFIVKRTLTTFTNFLELAQEIRDAQKLAQNIFDVT